MPTLVSGTLDPGTGESPVSAFSWPAIFAGAVIATALSVMLIAIGAGFGLAAVSPWQGRGASAVAIAASAAIWVVVVQWLSSGIGAYLAGRLRTKFVGVHTHEVFFRDTANGFATWALATLLSAGMLAFVAGGAATPAADAGGYELDRMLRSDHPRSVPMTVAQEEATRAEAGRILAALTTGAGGTEDRAYLANLVAARAGIPATDAENRVDQAELHTTQAADAARRAASRAAILTGLSMLIGAFIACAAAALGGGQRDRI